MKQHTLSQAGFQQSARYLLLMRLSIASMQWLALTALWFLAPPLAGPVPLLLTLGYAVYAAGSWLWLSQHPPSFPFLVSLSLLADLLFLSLWLALTGGFTNPLVSLLLLPLATGLVLIPLRHSLALTLAAISLYSLLMRFPPPRTMDLSGVNYMQLHLMGMWGTFVLTALILLVVVGALALRLREQQQALAANRENRLRDEQIIALGLSAANVAHRLGTPLNTMTLVLDDLHHLPDAAPFEEDIMLLQQQLGICQRQLRTMTEAATRAREAATEDIELQDWLQRLKESATLLWPGATVRWPVRPPRCLLQVDATLDQALLNLIANALEASPEGVSIEAEATGRRLHLRIIDHGEGISRALFGHSGQGPVPSEKGLGVGLFLSNATIQRLGGQLSAETASPGQPQGTSPGTIQGTTMVIDLPVTDFQPINGDLQHEH
ncbi:sensor histidine kinase [uncultured Marinobacter sp.]|uniref:sensor histidine kinase n=1 Tax=uncultured Marinobacter sp. TaxID=187379 RepID=UPI0030D8C17E